MISGKQTILVVDDSPEEIDSLANILNDEYNVEPLSSGDNALQAICSLSPDLILIDSDIASTDSYELCRKLKEDYGTRHTPVLFLTEMDSVEEDRAIFEAGASDFIAKPLSTPVVMARVKTYLALSDQNRALESKVAERTKELNESRVHLIQHLGRAAEYKDNESGEHVIRISAYCYLIGLAAGMSEEEAALLRDASPMHDIGKIGVPEAILKKPGRLTEDEFETIKSHCTIGGDLIGDDTSELLKLAKVIALTHHEKWNGRGYPFGLEGEDIPRVGRIAAIADVFDALTSNRPYKSAWTIDEVVDLIRSEAGGHFDPQLVECFYDALPQIREVYEGYAGN